MWTNAQLESVAWDMFNAANNQKSSFGYQHFLLWVLFTKPVISYVKKQVHLRPAANTGIRDFFFPMQAHQAPPGRPPGRPYRRSM
jgi:hypothetical protein